MAFLCLIDITVTGMYLKLNQDPRTIPFFELEVATDRVLKLKSNPILTQSGEESMPWLVVDARVVQVKVKK